MIKIENRFFFILAFSMALVVALSNYLVQFPVNYIGLQDVFTYGAFSYPVAFLITDLANRKYGKAVAKRIVYIGFVLGVALTLYFSTDFSNLISKRIAIGSGSAFLIAQLLDVQVFDSLRKKVWFVAPLISSLIGSSIDTFLFFSIAFYGTGVNWVTLSLGDLFVKIFVALLMLIPFRILLSRIQEISTIEKKISV
jgi:queuosine precursor transporter|tara:strand:+ start:456 stop:1043 length:588 start_codon:yes stop_codon:yes gene_type:complete